MAYKINTDRTAAVCINTQWLPIDSKTPRGVKVLLLTSHGVAIIGYHPTTGTVGWHPLPQIPKQTAVPLWKTAIGKKMRMWNYKSYILEFLSSHSATTEQISSETDIPKNSVLSALLKMKKDGLVEGKKILQGRYWVYIRTIS